MLKFNEKKNIGNMIGDALIVGIDTTVQEPKLYKSRVCMVSYWSFYGGVLIN